MKNIQKKIIIILNIILIKMDSKQKIIMKKIIKKIRKTKVMNMK